MVSLARPSVLTLSQWPLLSWGRWQGDGSGGGGGRDEDAFFRALRRGGGGGMQMLPLEECCVQYVCRCALCEARNCTFCCCRLQTRQSAPTL